MAGRFVRVLRALRSASHAVDTDRRVRFTPNLYFQIPNLNGTLVSASIDNIQSMELSIDDMKALFHSIQDAHELHEFRKIKISDLSCTTDCRIFPNNAERVAITFTGPLGYAHSTMQREDIARALEEFDTKMTDLLHSGQHPSGAFHAVDTDRRVRFTPNLYFQIPSLKSRLISVSIENIQSMELSIDDMKSLFHSIRDAYELRELRKVKIGDLSCTTDCRPSLDNGQCVTITFNGPLGYTHKIMQREDIARALEEFDTKMIRPLYSGQNPSLA